MRVRVLGSVHVSGSEGGVTPSGQLRRGLLTVLATSGNRLVPRSKIMDALWFAAPPSADANLRNHVTALRADLDVAEAGGRERITVQKGRGGGAISLALGPQDLDLDEARLLAAAARHNLRSPSGAAEALLQSRRGLALWCGDFGVDLPCTGWFDGLSVTVSRLREELTETQCAAQLLTGDATWADHGLAALLDQRPDDGRRWFLAIAARFLSGNAIGALAELDRCRAHFGELGLDVPPPVLELHRPVLNAEREAVATLVRRYV